MQDNYRRSGRKQSVKNDALDGFVSAKPPKITTKATEPKLVQPYRQAMIRSARQGLKLEMPEGGAKQRCRLGMPLIRGRRNITKVARFAALGVVIVGVLSAVLISQGILRINKSFKGTAATAASLQSDVNPHLLKGEGDGRINILLVGIGGKGHDGGDLTDTILLASIDPVNKKASLLSVPRDLWVSVPGKGSMKINAAYANGKYAHLRRATTDNSNQKAIEAGLNTMNQTVEKVLGVPIHYNMMVNFAAFKQAVDTVGGVTVDVPEHLYDPSMAWENKRDPYLARAGIQTFDGHRALMYVRSRETSSDFARGERQKAMLLALKQKAVSAGVLANPAKVSGLLQTFGNNMQTDLSLADASKLYSIFKDIPNANVRSVSLAGTTSITASAAGTDSLVTTGTINGQSVVMPKAGLENFAAIQDFVRRQLVDGYIAKEKARVLILNGTTEAGLGQATADRMKSYGYTIIGVANAPSTSYANTVVVDRTTNNSKKYTKNYLEQRFTTTAVRKLPDSTIQTQNADFIVLLGGDETGNY